MNLQAHRVFYDNIKGPIELFIIYLYQLKIGIRDQFSNPNI